MPEIEKMMPHWANVLMIICRRPALTKATLDVDLLQQLFPSIFAADPVEPRIYTIGVGRSDAVTPGVPFREKAKDLFERAGVNRVSDLGGVDWKGALNLPRKLFMAHEGECARVRANTCTCTCRLI